MKKTKIIIFSTASAILLSAMIVLLCLGVILPKKFTSEDITVSYTDSEYYVDVACVFKNDTHFSVFIDAEFQILDGNKVIMEGEGFTNYEITPHTEKTSGVSYWSKPYSYHGEDFLLDLGAYIKITDLDIKTPFFNVFTIISTALLPLLGLSVTLLTYSCIDRKKSK